MKRRWTNRHRRSADRYRAERRWPEAEAAYRRHLRLLPDDGAIHVQLGHMLKEQDRLDEAVESYRAALRFADQAADVLPHLADALDRLDRRREALGAWFRLHALTCDSAILHRITALRGALDGGKATQLPADGLLFPLDDLFAYWRAHATTSGIQRVQMGLAVEALHHLGDGARFLLAHSRGTAPALDAGEFWLLDAAGVTAIIDYATGVAVDHATLKVMLDECEADAGRARPASGSTLLLLGAFWSHDLTLTPFLHAQRLGVRVGAVIYDIIPVSHPQFCTPSLVRQFTGALIELCSFADFLLPISDATCESMAGFLEQQGGRAVPMRTVRLAHVLPGTKDEKTPALPSRFAGRPYALYVSTIEGRKNHLYVVEAWRRMIAAGVGVPDLVFVGRLGWRIEPLEVAMRDTAMLGGRLHLLHDLSDAELQAMYDRAQFTLFTSLVEGWGLPIGESLAHGRPCVASATSSMPEVGGGFVDYVDPLDVDSGVGVLTRMIVDAGYRAARSREIVRGFVPRSWSAVIADMRDAMEILAGQPAPPRAPVRLPEGDVSWLADLAALPETFASYAAFPHRTLLDDRLLPPTERFGAAVRGYAGGFDLVTECGEGERIDLALRIAMAPWAETCRLHVGTTPDDGAGDGDGDGALTLRGDALLADEAVMIGATVGAGGVVHLRFDLSGDYRMPAGYAAAFAVGLRAIGYARRSDDVSRRRLIERFAFRHHSA